MSGAAPTIHATTACVPGLPFVDAAQRIAAGIEQPGLGWLSAAHVQLCPQSAGILDADTVAQVQALLPRTQLRLHATVRAQREYFVDEAAWFSHDSQPYYRRLAALSQQMHASAYVFHAGCRGRHPQGVGNFDDIVDMTHALTDLFGCVVAVEGMYPEVRDRARPGAGRHLISCWAEYADLLALRLPFALDLSHLNIVRTAEGPCDTLVRELLASEALTEIHVSANDGVRDVHQRLAQDDASVWWWPLLLEAAATRPEVPIFSEACEPRRPRWAS